MASSGVWHPLPGMNGDGYRVCMVSIGIGLHHTAGGIARRRPRGGWPPAEIVVFPFYEGHFYVSISFEALLLIVRGVACIATADARQGDQALHVGRLCRLACPLFVHIGWKPFVTCVDAAPDGLIITGLGGPFTVKVWLDAACERTIHAHRAVVRAVAVLPDGPFLFQSK